MNMIRNLAAPLGSPGDETAACPRPERSFSEVVG